MNLGDEKGDSPRAFIIALSKQISDGRPDPPLITKLWFLSLNFLRQEVPVEYDGAIAPKQTFRFLLSVSVFYPLECQ
jgi:hypothetical protein